jgi:ribA/ribD-fused uncharacterized protein
MIDSFKGKYGFLSNFAMADVEFDSFDFISVEHAYQYAKCMDPAYFILFNSQVTSADAKKNGRKVKMTDDWEARKFTVMFMLLQQKFSDKNPELKKALLETAGERLVEGNYWHDNTWGSCTCAKCGNKGENRLGVMLMQIRNDLDWDRFNGVAELLLEAKSIGFVGSRACTDVQLNRLGSVAGWAALTDKLGISGGCMGADQRAANKYVEYCKEHNFHVHMPWPQYNSKHQVPHGCTWDCWSDKYNKAPDYVVPQELKEEALYLAELHDLNRTKAYPHMMGRNALIVMHSDLLVYAINGGSAGTTHDVNIAKDIGVPTINVSDDIVWTDVLSFLKWEKENMNNR